MSAFSAAIDLIFADPNMAITARWMPFGTGPGHDVRIIRRAEDDVTAFGGAQVWSDTVRVDVRVSDIPDPAPGDHLIIADEAFEVQGEPLRDRERLVWTLDLRKP